MKNKKLLHKLYNEYLNIKGGASAPIHAPTHPPAHAEKQEAEKLIKNVETNIITNINQLADHIPLTKDLIYSYINNSIETEKINNKELVVDKIMLMLLHTIDLTKITNPKRSHEFKNIVKSEIHNYTHNKMCTLSHLLLHSPYKWVLIILSILLIFAFIILLTLTIIYGKKSNSEAVITYPEKLINYGTYYSVDENQNNITAVLEYTIQCKYYPDKNMISITSDKSFPLIKTVTKGITTKNTPKTNNDSNTYITYFYNDKNQKKINEVREQLFDTNGDKTPKETEYNKILQLIKDYIEKQTKFNIPDTFNIDFYDKNIALKSYFEIKDIKVGNTS